MIINSGSGVILRLWSPSPTIWLDERGGGWGRVYDCCRAPPSVRASFWTLVIRLSLSRTCTGVDAVARAWCDDDPAWPSSSWHASLTNSITLTLALPSPSASTRNMAARTCNQQKKKKKNYYFSVSSIK